MQRCKINPKEHAGEEITFFIIVYVTRSHKIMMVDGYSLIGASLYDMHSFLIDPGIEGRGERQVKHGVNMDGVGRHGRKDGCREGYRILCNVTPTKNHFAVARSTAQ